MIQQSAMRFALFFLGFAGACLAAGGERTVVIHAGRLFDGKSDRLLSNQVVVIQGDRITDVEPSERVKLPANAEEIDLGNSTVLPGLIDGHAHVFKWSGLSLSEETVRANSSEYRTILAVLNAKRDLEAGFTTMRDCMSMGTGYSDTDVRRAINEGLIPGPRLQVATIALMGTNGGSQPKAAAPEDTSIMRVVDSPWEGRKAVRDNIAHGADFIKVFLSTIHGIGPDGKVVVDPTMSVEEERAIVDEAHQHRVKAACNVQGGAPLLDAIEAGCDTIELPFEVPPEAVNKMARNGVFLTLPLARTQAKESSAREATHGVYSQLAMMRREGFGRALGAGVKIAFAPNAGSTSGPDHGTQAMEFEYMVKCGMTPLQALRAATSVNAEMMGWQDRIGSIEKGKYADLVAVSGNPLEDVTELERVKFVMKGGKIVRNDLK